MKPQQPKTAPTNNQTTDQAIDKVINELIFNVDMAIDGKLTKHTAALQAKATLSQLLANEVRKAETRARIEEIERIQRGANVLEKDGIMAFSKLRLISLEGETTHE